MIKSPLALGNCDDWRDFGFLVFCARGEEEKEKFNPL